MMSTLNIIWSTINSLILILLPIIAKSWADKKLTKLKSSLSKGEFIHRLQFEKEFEIYQELWANLIKLKDSAELSTLHIAFKTKGDHMKGVEGRMITKLMDNINNTQRTIENNRPFYSEEIYNNALKIVELTKTFFPRPKYIGEKDIERLSKLVQSKSQIYKIISNIDKAIRERIEILEKPN